MIQVRNATLLDAEEIASIYNHEILHSTATFDVAPRSIVEQRQWLHDRSGSLAVLVAESGKKVAGFASLSRYRQTHGYSASVENSIYVDSQYRGRGIGKMLLDAILLLAKSHGYHSVFARISANQVASQKLHERKGYTMVGVEREVGRKFGKWHDVRIMQLLIREMRLEAIEKTGS